MKAYEKWDIQEVKKKYTMDPGVVEEKGMQIEKWRHSVYVCFK